ncbi:MAG: phage holin family protein [Candidatus Krumholzibacteria bacterium]|nr:phage holin family protein [Candidatus Krumholzibacteria bacterium]MDH4336744.1 phage holin family protein [Candidatus Krumholzibacteria bacterium]MDH5270481.1 phage holin family protein [Candidatus Krumholzibacteria bacterium]MDH5626925.1 phage holin family protein [Candidatus Krumholzibacteria bacterium]
MRGFLIRGLLAALGLWVASALLPGVHSGGLLPILGAGLLLGLVNAIIRPIIVILTLPITIVTLGLFLLVVNALMVWLVGKMMGGFGVDGFGSALLTAIIVSFVSWCANAFIGPRGNFERFSGGRKVQ